VSAANFVQNFNVTTYFNAVWFHSLQEVGSRKPSSCAETVHHTKSGKSNRDHAT